ncbi:LysR family transcriptional regulator [Phyllobacterium myrsinacearum]|uniref:DNA-binding transcriptional LysR family regulator n=1 Tax=Phyllobacterium myrsinacearum TaxID=28101 RepID=A0A839EBI4_9HYPH|nr:LysR family transcriptional regulator [Phyllobacterium myrsinacearum]MBA8877261.1 DNA-binding transcriptional LysR family regulator [Phyllobacterium myrsinacearum]
MDLRQLRYFITVAEELHFGRAAARLNMTQPPLSQTILALEEEIGVELFTRTKRSVQLTPAGTQWLDHVRALLEGAAALPGIARQLSQGTMGSLKLAFVSTADYSLLPTLLGRYKTDHPDVQIALQEATSDLQIEALLGGDIHAGLIIPPSQASLHTSLAYVSLLEEELVAAVPDEWIMSGRFDLSGGALDIHDVLLEPLIIFPRRSAPAFHDLITGYYVANGAVPFILQEAIQMQTIISLVSAGMGMALVPQSLQNLGRTGVRYLKLSGKPPRIETGLVWRRDDPSPTLRHLIDIASTFNGSP